MRPSNCTVSGHPAAKSGRMNSAGQGTPFCMDHEHIRVRMKETARDLRENKKIERVRDMAEEKVDALKDRIHQLSRNH